MLVSAHPTVFDGGSDRVSGCSFMRSPDTCSLSSGFVMSRTEIEARALPLCLSFFLVRATRDRNTYPPCITVEVEKGKLSPGGSPKQ
jgi:hypothetical protein